MSFAQAPAPSCPEPDKSSIAATQDGDAETDIEIMKTVPQQFEVADEKSANWLIRRIIESRSYAQRVKRFAEQELRRAAREEQTLMFIYGRQLERWAKSEIEKQNGRRKSVNLPAGCVAFRTTPTRIVVDDESRVITWARANLPSAIVMVEKLSRSILNEYAEKTGVIPDDGVHIEPSRESFSIR